MHVRQQAGEQPAQKGAGARHPRGMCPKGCLCVCVCACVRKLIGYLMHLTLRIQSFHSWNTWGKLHDQYIKAKTY